MAKQDRIIEGIGAIFIIYIFLKIIPELNESTGMSFPFLSISLIFLAIIIAFSIIKEILDYFKIR